MKREAAYEYEQQPENPSRGKILREQLLEAVLSPDQLPKISYQEFLTYADEDRPAEWVNGEIILMSPASRRHQRLVRFLTFILGGYVESLELGELFPAPFQMKLESGREPDLLFIANRHLDRLKPTYLDGPADLVIEIISPESVERDRIDKYHEYERGGVQEFWLIDPEQQSAEFYALDDDGRYQPIAIDADGIFHSTVADGFWLHVEWLWSEPLPKMQEVLKALQVL